MVAKVITVLALPWRQGTQNATRIRAATILLDEPTKTDLSAVPQEIVIDETFKTGNSRSNENNKNRDIWQASQDSDSAKGMVGNNVS